MLLTILMCNMTSCGKSTVIALLERFYDPAAARRVLLLLFLSCT